MEGISKNNGDADQILGLSGLSMEHIGDPNFEFNLQQYCRLFSVAAKQTGNDNFGLQFGHNFHPKHLGPIGYAAISSPTLAAGLKAMENYFPAHQSFTSFGIVQDSDILWLNYRINDERISEKRHDAELSMGMFHNIFRQALGQDWAPLEVRFEHQKPDDASEHEKLFNAPVKFGRRTNALAFRRKDLDARMPGNDPFLYSIIKPMLEERCSNIENPEDFASIVRNQIKLNMRDTAPNMAKIAQLLGMSSHKFQIELKQRGLNFNDLLRAARQELALHYLTNSNLPLTDIALSLGYSELSAFSRAFRAWCGMSPQRYRRLQS